MLPSSQRAGPRQSCVADARVLGAERAALLQARLIEHAAEIASRSAIGPVTLWAAPDESDSLFQAVHVWHGITIARQSEGDLGARMARVAHGLPPGPVVIVGSDIPDLTAAHVAAAFRKLGQLMSYKKGGTAIVQCLVG